ncbi:hypothetical protein pdam_00002367, partial [Pocillopora damicornis]
PAIHVVIRSEGCEDNAPGVCGKAYIQVNGAEYSQKHNVVVVQGATVLFWFGIYLPFFNLIQFRSGQVLSNRAFDTHGSQSEGVRLRDYLNAIRGNYIVLVAIGDEGSLHVSPAINALKRLGASDPDVTVKLRESYALIGYAGDNKPSWIEQKSARKANGPSIISSRILLKLCKLRHFTPQTLLDIR